MIDTQKERGATLRGTFQAVLAAAGSGFMVQHVVEGVWPHAGANRPIMASISGVAAFLLLAAAGSTRGRLRFLSSRHLAVASLTVLTVFGILGTVIIQAAHPSSYESTYGAAAPLIRYLFLDDVFHSMPFALVMGTAAAGLGLSFFQKKTIDTRRAGVLATHAGCLLVLAGAAIQPLAGIKGRLEIREGETADGFLARTGEGTMHPLPLGFSIRLDAFELLSYEPQIRLRLFEVDGHGQDLVASFDPAAVLEDPAGLLRFGVRVTDWWPDHEMRYEVEPATTGEPGVPALGLKLPGSETAWMLDTGRMEDARIRVGEGAIVTFFWNASAAAAFAGDGPGPGLSPHVVVTHSGPLRVEVGSTYTLPGHEARFHVKAFYHDLMLDPQTRQASNRSDEPRNPALHVELLDPQGSPQGSTWLFANYPTFHSTDTTSPLAGIRYSYEAGAGQMESWVVTGESRQIRRLGAEGSQELPDGPEQLVEMGGVQVGVAGLIESASVRTTHTTRSGRPLRPVVRIRHAGQEERSMFLPEGYAADLGDGLHIVLARKEDTDRDYLSTVSIIEGGQVVKRGTLEVNHPLRHRGFTFYQSDFNPEDLAWSGLQIVRDPGLPVVYTGFVVCIAGILVAFYLGPWMKRRRRRGG